MRNRALLRVFAIVLALLLTLTPTRLPPSGIGIGPLPVGAEEEPMKQMIIGGYDGWAYDERYNTVVGGYSWATVSDERRQIVSTNGSFSDFYVELSAAPGSGKSYEFTLMKNGSPTAIVVTISDSATTGSDTSHNASVVAGDEINIYCDRINTPAGAYAHWSIIFEGDNPYESLILGMSETSTTTTRYSPISQGGPYSITGPEDENYQVIPTNGTIENFYVVLASAVGTGSYTFTVNKNGVATSLAVTISSGTTGNNTADEVSVVAGDYVDLEITPNDSPTGGGDTALGFTFVADTNGESIILGQLSTPPPADSTVYLTLSTTYIDNIYSYDEYERYQGGQSGTVLRDFYVRMVNTAAGDKVYRVRANGANTDLVVTISSLGTTGSDTTHNYTVGNWDELTLSVYQPGPTVAYFHWGVVCYIAPGEEECSPSISLNTYSWIVNGGSPVATGSNYTTGLGYFNVTNNSGGAIDITISGQNMTGGGYTWELSNTGTAGDMVYGLNAGLSGGSYNITVKLDSPYNSLVEDLADEASQLWGLQIFIPTNFDDPNTKSGNVTLTAACA